MSTKIAMTLTLTRISPLVGINIVLSGVTQKTVNLDKGKERKQTCCLPLAASVSSLPAMNCYFSSVIPPCHATRLEPANSGLKLL